MGRRQNLSGPESGRKGIHGRKMDPAGINRLRVGSVTGRQCPPAQGAHKDLERVHAARGQRPRGSKWQRRGHCGSKTAALGTQKDLERDPQLDEMATWDLNGFVGHSIGRGQGSKKLKGFGEGTI